MDVFTHNNSDHVKLWLNPHLPLTVAKTSIFCNQKNRNRIDYINIKFGYFTYISAESQCIHVTK